MYRPVKAAVALVTSSLAIVCLQAAPAHAAPTSTSAPATVLVGRLGVEGGAYPGGFHPTAGSVEVAFQSVPLVLDKRVGPSGHFRIPLGPGVYTVVGCGPTSSSTQSQECSKPKTVTLTWGEVRHITLIWAYVP